MIEVSSEELLSIVGRIDEAMEAHEKWQGSMMRVLICHTTIPENDLSHESHRRCEFGRWFYGACNAHLLNLSAFRRIEALHIQLHEKSRSVFERRLTGRLLSTNDYDAYAQSAELFRAELRSLRNRATLTLTSTDPITGALRKGQLIVNLRSAIEDLKINGRSCSLLLIDLDIREINKRDGSAVGDAVLRAAVREMSDIDGGERIFRLLAGQFAILVPGFEGWQIVAHEGRVRNGIRRVLSAVDRANDLPIAFNSVILELKPDVEVLEQLDGAIKLLNNGGATL